MLSVIAQLKMGSLAAMTLQFYFAIFLKKKRKKDLNSVGATDRKEARDKNVPKSSTIKAETYQ